LLSRLLTFSVALAAMAFATGVAAASPMGARPFKEPVILSSKDGVLEVTLTPRQTTASLDTVARPVLNMLLFDYSVEKGTASDGQLSGAHMYPAPTLHVEPGERLIVHIDNELRGLSIPDFYDPKYTPVGQTVPKYPAMLTSAPINLHVHGAHVSPRGNADNVLLHIDAGMSNTYVYDIPKNMTPGTYWYHSHLHTLTAMQTYFGLAGMLLVGRADSDIPLVTQNHIPIRTMLLQYNTVFDRQGGMAQMTNPNWPQWVSTLIKPEGDQLAKGTYRPLLAPVNFLQSPKGTQWATVWYTGPLSIENKRGRFQFIPTNLQRFTPFDKGGPVVKADLALPDYERDTQFTVNGQFEPVLNVKPGQTEIWVLANVSDIAYMNVRLTETATGYHPKIAVVGQDGIAYGQVEYPHEMDGTELLIPPASRYAISVTMPAKGGLRMELPGLGSGARAFAAPGVLYTNNGTKNPPAHMGSLSILPESISYADGFFMFPSQTLLNAVPEQGQGVTTAFAPGQQLDAPTPFHDLSQVTPDVKRTMLINGGFLNNHASKQDPKAFVYAFFGNAFPNVPLIQARLGSVEEWDFVNHNNDAHPIHVHVNDFQVTEYDDPTTGLKLGPQMHGEDNANVPAPLLGPEESVIQPGTLAMRTRFIDYLGLYVLHCHRLNHEDNGLMMLVNVIPAVSDYAVAVPGSPGHPATVNVIDGNGDRLIATVTPFTDFFGTPTVTMGDVDGDGAYDLIVGAGKGHSPEVVAYSGAAGSGGKPFTAELARFQAFDPSLTGGVSVASTQIDGRSPDNIVVGTGAGTKDQVRIFGSELPAVGTAPATFASFEPYGDDTSGVNLAAGFVDFLTGRNSIVTAAGSGGQVKVFSYSLMTPIGAPPAWPNNPGAPHVDAAFMPFGDGYRGPISIATGWLAGQYGGAEAITAGQLSGSGTVKVFSTTTALQGAPKMYLHSAMMHEMASDFSEIASFQPFAGASSVRVATTSTTIGADLLASGGSADAQKIEKYRLKWSNPDDRELTATPVHAVWSGSGTTPAIVGGD
jgi:FtsP/CotA-like multicopper oxidase with cupredoxin domain